MLATPVDPRVQLGARDALVVTTFVEDRQTQPLRAVGRADAVAMDPTERAALDELRRVDDQVRVGGSQLLEEAGVRQVVGLVSSENHTQSIGSPGCGVKRAVGSRTVGHSD
ncbi:MAG: hypothetical protein AAF385_03610 [Pseudomonadota bacterium]